MVNTGPSAGPRSALARTSPSSMTIMNSGLSPSHIRMSPAARRSSWHLETNQSRSSCGRSENTATLRNCSTSCSGGVINSSVMRDVLFWRRASLNFGQILVHELDDDGAFAYSGGDAFGGAMAHVANNKNSGHVGFEKAGIAGERPGGGLLAIVNQVGARKDEAAVVALDDITEPFGAGKRTDEDEKATGGQRFGFAGRRALDRDAGEARVTVHRRDAGLRPDFNLGCFLDLLDQIVRHGAGQGIAADEHNDFFGEFREVHGGLAGGIRCADDVHRFAPARNGFRCAPAIVNASSLEAINARHVECPPLNAHGEEKDVTGDFRAIGEFQVAIRAIDSNASSFLRSKNLHSKTLRLRDGAPGEVAASESGRKA